MYKQGGRREGEKERECLCQLWEKGRKRWGIKQWDKMGDKMSAIGDSEKKYKEALCTIFYNFSVNLKLHQNKYLKIYIFWLLSEKSVAETTEEYWLP